MRVVQEDAAVMEKLDLLYQFIYEQSEIIRTVRNIFVSYLIFYEQE